MSDDPFEYVTPPLKIVRDMVAIPRAQHEALMAAAKILLEWYPHASDKGVEGCNCDECRYERAAFALRAAGIQTGK